MARRFLRFVDVALLVVATLRAAIDVWRAPRWTVDDAWIVARYADHLVQHGVFAFNLTGDRVEGITSPLFALVGAAGSAIGAGAVPAMTAVAVGSYVATGAILFAFAREMRAPAPCGGAVALAYLAIAEHATHATSGLETEAFLAAQAACAWALARALRGVRGGGVVALVAACAVLSLLRPEGIAISAVLLATLALRMRGRAPPEKRRMLRVVGAAWALPVVALVVARLAYFHALVPNTYFAKRGEANAVHVGDLALIANRSVADIALAGAGLLLLSRLLGAGRTRVSPRWRALAFASLAVVAVNVAAYARADLVMNFGRRFAMHATPWMAVLALGVAAVGVERLLRVRARLPATLLGGVAALAAAACIARNAPERETRAEWVTRYDRTSRTLYLPVAARLAADPRAVLAVYPDAGIIPYRTGLFTIDFGRLNDAYLARDAHVPADVARYFFERDPDVLVVSQRSGRLWDDGAEAIVGDPRFGMRYEEAMDSMGEDGSGLRVYQRRR